MTSIRPTQRST